MKRSADLLTGEAFVTCLTGNRGVVLVPSCERKMIATCVILGGKTRNLAPEVRVFSLGRHSWLTLVLHEATQTAKGNPGVTNFDPVEYRPFAPRDRRSNGQFGKVSER